MKDVRNKVRKGMAAGVTAVLGTMNFAKAATGLDPIIKPFTNINTLLTTIASAIGGVWLVIALIQFAFAFHQNDPQGKQSAIKGVVTAALLLSTGIVLTFVLS